MLAKLILDGIVGPLRIGLSKAELLTLVGPPPTWEGKPGTIFNRGIVDYNNSATWVYNGVHVEIKNGVIDKLIIWSDYHLMDWDHEWFREWPLSLHPRLSEVRDYLDSEQIPYAITAKQGEFGFDIVMFEAYVLGAPIFKSRAELRNLKLEDVNVHGIVRVRRHNDVPSVLDPSINIIELMPKRSRP